jgi:hypothetical protein
LLAPWKINWRISRSGGGSRERMRKREENRAKPSDFIELFNFQNKYLRAIGNNLWSGIGISNRPRHAIIYLSKTKGQRAEGGRRKTSLKLNSRERQHTKDRTYWKANTIAVRSAPFACESPEAANLTHFYRVSKLSHGRDGERRAGKCWPRRWEDFLFRLGWKCQLGPEGLLDCMKKWKGPEKLSVKSFRLQVMLIVVTSTSPLIHLTAAFAPRANEQK